MTPKLAKSVYFSNHITELIAIATSNQTEI